MLLGPKAGCAVQLGVLRLDRLLVLPLTGQRFKVNSVRMLGLYDACTTASRIEVCVVGLSLLCTWSLCFSSSACTVQFARHRAALLSTSPWVSGSV